MGECTTGTAARPLVGRILAIAALSVAARAAQAQPISIGTGTNGSGVVLADGAADPVWTNSVAGGPFNAAVVLFPNDQCRNMGTVNTAVAKWIGSATNPGPIAEPSGWRNVSPTVIRRTFDPTGYDPSTVGMGGSWRAADGIVGAFLNGNLLFTSRAIDAGGNQVTTNRGADNPFSVAAGSPAFVAGVDTLDFQMETLDGVFDGLYVDATVRGQAVAAVPEPASVALVATGVLALAGVARRRRGA